MTAIRFALLKLWRVILGMANTLLMLICILLLPVLFGWAALVAEYREWRSAR